MDTTKMIFISVATFSLVLGLFTMITGQICLLSKIIKWNAVKAYIGIFPFFLFLFLKFDNQVKIISKRHPVYISYLKNGLIITLTGAVSLFLAVYL